MARRYRFNVSYRSDHVGLAASISISFQLRRHSLIWRSRRNAPSRVSQTSYQTSRSQPYRAVKPGKALDLCCQIRP